MCGTLQEYACNYTEGHNEKSMDSTEQTKHINELKKWHILWEAGQGTLQEGISLKENVNLYFVECHVRPGPIALFLIESGFA